MSLCGCLHKVAMFIRISSNDDLIEPSTDRDLDGKDTGWSLGSKDPPQVGHRHWSLSMRQRKPFLDGGLGGDCRTMTQTHLGSIAFAFIGQCDGAISPIRRGLVGRGMIKAEV
jgi:hypothetical protein